MFDVCKLGCRSVQRTNISLQALIQTKPLGSLTCLVGGVTSLENIQGVWAFMILKTLKSCHGYSGFFEKNQLHITTAAHHPGLTNSRLTAAADLQATKCQLYCGPCINLGFSLRPPQCAERSTAKCSATRCI